MTDAIIGRLLVASLHQAVGELLPLRQEFYSSWLNPANLRAGSIGLAPLAAVLSFLRQEGEPYSRVTGRAGQFAAEWTYASMSSVHRTMIQLAPPRLRMRLVLWLMRSLVRGTCRTSRLSIRWRKGRGAAIIKGSIFCEVRDRVELPLCEYYATAIRRLAELFGLEAEVVTEHCRAVEGGACQFAVAAQAPSGHA